MTPNLKSLLDLWPYVLVSAGLIAALIALVITTRHARNKLRKWKIEEEVIYNELSYLRDMADQRLKNTELLRGILTRTHPYFRAIQNNPAKLEAWLQTLKKPKGKKKTAKPSKK